MVLLVCQCVLNVSSARHTFKLQRYNLMSYHSITHPFTKHYRQINQHFTLGLVVITALPGCLLRSMFLLRPIFRRDQHERDLRVKVVEKLNNSPPLGTRSLTIFVSSSSLRKYTFNICNLHLQTKIFCCFTVIIVLLYNGC